MTSEDCLSILKVQLWLYTAYALDSTFCFLDQSSITISWTQIYFTICLVYIHKACLLSEIFGNIIPYFIAVLHTLFKDAKKFGENLNIPKGHTKI